MYGVNNGLRIDYLVGMYLTSVELCVAQIGLHFQEVTGVGSSLYIRGKFSISRVGTDDLLLEADCSSGMSDLVQREHGIEALASLARLLSQEIERVQIVKEEDRIRLEFPQGGALSVWDSNSPYYESFEIHHGADIYIV